MATAIPDIHPFYEKDTSTIQYVVACPQTKKAAIIDSVLDYKIEGSSTSTKTADEIIAFVKERKYDLDWVLETHAHADHISAAPYLKQQLNHNAKIGIGEGIKNVQSTFKGIFNLKDLQPDGSHFDALFKDGEKFHIGNLEVEVLHTPGHTPACITYYIGKHALFVGDTIFMPDQGTARCDFPHGSAELLWNSIHKILNHPDDTKIFTCHDYQPGGRAPAWETTVGEEKAKNIHVKEGTKVEQFVEWRKTRDASLAPPRYILPSIQVNIRAGKFPKPEDNGHYYLKIPMNVFSKQDNGIVPDKIN